MYEFPYTLRAVGSKCSRTRQRRDNAYRVVVSCARFTNHTTRCDKVVRREATLISARNESPGDRPTRRSLLPAGIGRGFTYPAWKVRVLFQGNISTNKRKLTKRILGRFDLEVQFTRAALRKQRHVAVDRFPSHRARQLSFPAADNLEPYVSSNDTRPLYHESGGGRTSSRGEPAAKIRRSVCVCVSFLVRMYST